ncbi:TPA: hypothetical protein U1C34_000414 [Streptococcus suis]|nr:hypothetical protein [Streptococcus suis]HEM3621655.1 hypothetical protein [Streptococcus suis]HEM3643500.1 hypothetical protein [Streptococcus suis]
MRDEIIKALEMIRSDKATLEHNILMGKGEDDNFLLEKRLNKNYRTIFNYVKDYLAYDDRLVPISLRKGTIGMRYRNLEGIPVLVTYKPFYFIHNFEYDRCFSYEDFMKQLELKCSLWDVVADQVVQLSNAKKVVVDTTVVDKVIPDMDENDQ